MFKNIKSVFLRGFDFESVSVISISHISLFVFFITSTLYASLVFVQFSFLKVLFVSLVFLTLFMILSVLFLREIFSEKIKMAPINILVALLVAVFLTAVFHSPDPEYDSYYRTFPLLELELGLGWHNDSAFHTSIIHSFNLFGYPSIGQNGTPILFYHVLSHFIDSVIVFVTGIDVWQSYGMFYYFKGVFFITSIMYFITSVSRSHKLYVFLLSLTFLMPIIVAKWNAIGSHGLWFTTLVVIVSSPFVFKLISQKTPIRLIKFLILFSLFVVISLGKISSGFIYSALVGMILLLSHFKDIRVYIFGFFLLVFFATYYSLMGGSQASSVSFSFYDSLNFLVLKADTYYGQLYQVYLILLLVGIMALLFRSKIAIRLTLASVLLILVLSVILTINENGIEKFNRSDVWYFIYGLSSVLILLTYQLAINVLASKEIRQLEGFVYLKRLSINVLTIVSLIFLTTELNSAKFNFLNYNLKTVEDILEDIYIRPFLNLNSYDTNLNVNIIKQFFNRSYIDLDAYPRPLKVFNSSLKVFMLDNKLNANDSLLFMPEELFDSEFKRFQGGDWARGMLLYAVTGVPLLHGIKLLVDKYGYADYDESATWKSGKEFDRNSACDFKKNIIIVESFSKHQFSLVQCK